MQASDGNHYNNPDGMDYTVLAIGYREALFISTPPWSLIRNLMEVQVHHRVCWSVHGFKTRAWELKLAILRLV